MTDEAPKSNPFSGLSRRVLSILIGLVVTLIVGAVAERVTDKEWLASAKTAQDEWVAAVQHTSPISVATMFSSELQASFSGTVKDGDATKTAGGRVLCVTALGDSVKMAQKRAYDALEHIRFDGMQFRRDIGFRAIGVKRESR
jgi:phosphoribosylamine--glycine ligase